MNLSDPLAHIYPGLSALVLKELYQTEVPQSGRKIANRINKSQKGVQSVLDRLVSQGVVFRTLSGKAYLYTLNRDHLATLAVALLSEIRSRLLTFIEEEIKGWSLSPEKVILYGSFARADGSEDSDIDVCIVRSNDIKADNEQWLNQISVLEDKIYAWTGNYAEILELTENEFTALQSENRLIARNLTEEGIEINLEKVYA